MEASISVVVPVHNAQDRLRREIPELLEVLADLTSKFEVIVVDDGSDDRTEDVGYDLSHEYPQVRFTSHRRSLGLEAAGRTGLSLAIGDIVFVHEVNGPVSTTELERLWGLRRDSQLVVARAEPDVQPLSPEMAQRLAVWGAVLRRSAQKHTGQGGLQMIRVQGVRRLVEPGVQAGICRVDGPSQPAPKHLSAGAAVAKGARRS